MVVEVFENCYNFNPFSQKMVIFKVPVPYKIIQGRSRNSDLPLREAGDGAGAERNIFASTTLFSCYNKYCCGVFLVVHRFRDVIPVILIAGGRRKVLQGDPPNFFNSGPTVLYIATWRRADY